MKRYWRITGYRSLDKIFETDVPISHLSENQLIQLLKSLTAKAGLQYDEIVGAYTRKNSITFNGLLSVEKDGLYPNYRCGGNPYFHAKIIKKDIF